MTTDNALDLTTLAGYEALGRDAKLGQVSTRTGSVGPDLLVVDMDVEAAGSEVAFPRTAILGVDDEAGTVSLDATSSSVRDLPGYDALRPEDVPAVVVTGPFDGMDPRRGSA
ncbi:hypothetical protein AB0M43_09680 [Longispora sp. NPDC051575]|uniref:hypothetical protein n=1 Tax=Longispora sp. NPDC051575 TaxID=3154943 RepID=UPI00343EC635